MAHVASIYSFGCTSIKQRGDDGRQLRHTTHTTCPPSLTPDHCALRCPLRCVQYAHTRNALGIYSTHSSSSSSIQHSFPHNIPFLCVCVCVFFKIEWQQQIVHGTTMQSAKALDDQQHTRQSLHLFCVCRFFSWRERERYFDRFFGYIEYITMALGLLSYIGSGGERETRCCGYHRSTILHSMLCVVCVCVCQRVLFLLDIRCIHIQTHSKMLLIRLLFDIYNRITVRVFCCYKPLEQSLDLRAIWRSFIDSLFIFRLCVIRFYFDLAAERETPAVAVFFNRNS